MPETDLKQIAKRLIGVEGNVSIEPIAGGGNNKIYLVTAGGGKYILKHYFRHKDDRRSRLESEFLFTSFAWNHEIRHVAEPVAHDKASSVGIYKFVEGGKFKPGDLGEEEIGQALSFFKELNRYRSDAVGLPNASEACFSIEDHVRLVDYRVDRLKAIEIIGDIDREALNFVNNELAGRWQIVRKEILSRADHNKISITERISSEDTVISPSDFGFHNAIIGSDGVIRFIDFEYAGWDDPAKTVGDFFSQVAVPVPMTYFEKFVETVSSCVYNAEKTGFRIRLLLPLYRIKWCCIVLNHFLPVDRERKYFADEDAMGKKYGQLAKARTLLNSLREGE